MVKPLGTRRISVPVALTKGRQRPHSASSGYLMVPRTRTSVIHVLFICILFYLRSLKCENTHIVSTEANDATAAVACLTACIVDINDWMKVSRLRLNAFKTQVMWLGSSQQLAKITVRDFPLLSTVVAVVDSVRDLGVIIDSQLCMDAHVAALYRGGYYQLRQLLPVSVDKSCQVISPCACVESTGLDYCNALLYGVADGLYRRLQSVQNAASRLVSGFTAP